MPEILTTNLPTEFRGCIWDDGWEFDAPCVVYYPAKYMTYQAAGNYGAVEQMVEEIAFAIEEQEAVNDGGLEQEMEWRGWSKRGFARRKNATHVVVKGQWVPSDDSKIGVIFEIASIDTFDGPPKDGRKINAY